MRALAHGAARDRLLTIMIPKKIMSTLKSCSVSERGMMFMPTEVVAETAQKTARPYCCASGKLAVHAPGTQRSGAFGSYQRVSVSGSSVTAVGSRVTSTLQRHWFT